MWLNNVYTPMDDDLQHEKVECLKNVYREYTKLIQKELTIEFEKLITSIMLQENISRQEAISRIISDFDLKIVDFNYNCDVSEVEYCKYYKKRSCKND